MLFKLLVCLIAGLGAGVGTGLAGLSAAAVISPMLISLLGVPAYQAVGIALASDVLASAISAYTYGKHKKLDIKNGLIMMGTVLIFTLVGSYLSNLVPNQMIGNFSMYMTFLVGVKFIVKPITTTPEVVEEKSTRTKIIESILCGILVGFICGFVGAGGGMMLLLILTSVLGYELKTAVGTSVFIMTFTALTGGISHFIIGDVPNLEILFVCMFFTLVGARVSARFANKASAKVLNRTLGVVLTIIGALMIIIDLLN
ncbi:sulfite exporter TauE/SafE family protein [Turicibacter sanguinis]|uniref:sulfite exporter TauE/SafE family protein n=1 Tax=Turicibacter sanguinis TaxID=154288 RepID=UPI0018A95A86|nr:sulfite exporter TauE/SafE family protein [Turicibacter sanguinis]MDB8552792.1 sulfite exporter TauE/SafE family protein [Turicibacter sanguinis]